MQPSSQSVDELKKVMAEARKKGTAPANGEPQFGPDQGVMQTVRLAASGMIAELCSADGGPTPNFQWARCVTHCSCCSPVALLNAEAH